MELTQARLHMGPISTWHEAQPRSRSKTQVFFPFQSANPSTEPEQTRRARAVANRAKLSTRDVRFSRSEVFAEKKNQLGKTRFDGRNYIRRAWRREKVATTAIFSTCVQPRRKGPAGLRRSRRPSSGSAGPLWTSRISLSAQAAAAAAAAKERARMAGKHN